MQNLKEYEVEVVYQQTLRNYVTIDAASPKEAKKIAQEKSILDNGTIVKITVLGARPIK